MKRQTRREGRREKGKGREKESGLGPLWNVLFYWLSWEIESKLSVTQRRWGNQQWKYIDQQAVPNLFGSTDWFCGRISPQAEGGGGIWKGRTRDRAQAVIWAKGLLTSCCVACFLTGQGPVLGCSQGLGTLDTDNTKKVPEEVKLISQVQD